MTPFWEDDHLTLYGGDCREVLRELPAESVHCVVTSPPYFALRDYGVTGQIGLEATIDEWVASMVDVFRLVRRVLRKDGTLWLNLGDGFGDKQLLGGPWRVAFALQADGWYLRSDIIWAKPNPMPESVTDRPTKAHEYLFLLTRSPRYYYDAEAVREPHTAMNIQQQLSPVKDRGDQRQLPKQGYHDYLNPAGRNLRSVWNIDYNTDEEVEWTTAIGSCRRCGGLRVAGNGSEPMTSKATDGSKPSTGNGRTSSAPTELPTNSLWVPSHQDSPSTTSAVIEDASTPSISNLSPSAPTSSEATPSPLGTPARTDVSTDTRSRLRTLTDALVAANVGCVCGTGSESGELSSVWPIATEPYPGSHFATFPRKLVEPCVKAGTSERGVCPECGAPWVRETVAIAIPNPGHNWGPRGDANRAADERTDLPPDSLLTRRETTGWRPSCTHEDLTPVPATVLDMFAGSGTTLLVAQSLGRRGVGIDLSPDYLKQALERNRQTPLGLVG